MDFDGDEKVRDHVQQGQTLMNQMAQMQQMMLKMGQIVERLTGQDVFADPQQEGGNAPQAAKQAPRGESMGKAQKDAQTETMTAYGEKLAKRAKPDMNQA